MVAELISIKTNLVLSSGLMRSLDSHDDIKKEFDTIFIEQHEAVIRLYHPIQAMKNLFGSQRPDDVLLSLTRPLSKAMMKMVVERECNCEIEIAEFTDCWLLNAKNENKLGDTFLGERINVYHSHFSIIINLRDPLEWKKMLQDKMITMSSILSTIIPANFIVTVQFNLFKECFPPLFLSSEAQQALGFESILSYSKEVNRCYVLSYPILGSR